MLRKEFQGVLKQSLFFLAVVAGVSLIIQIAFSKHVGSYFEVFYLMYQFSLLVFGAFMGLSVFLSDKKQRAEEYVFSLPYSRLRLLGIKVLPRLIAVVIFYLFFLLIHLGVGKGFIPQEVFFNHTWFYWLLFFMGLSFSASADGYMKAAGISLLGIIVLLQLLCFSRQLAFLLTGGQLRDLAGWNMFTLLTFNFTSILVPFLVVCICLLLPYIISFVFTYKKWGTYSKENYNKSYFKLFLPLIAVGLIISTLFVDNSIVRRYHEVMLRATMSDMSYIGRALKNYIEDCNQAPKANSIKELSKILQPFYIKTLPLADAWENELLYKVDPREPGKYWVASPGSDGKFEGFDQEGTWKLEEGKKCQDIILANGDFTYKPELDEKK